MTGSNDTAIINELSRVTPLEIQAGCSMDELEQLLAVHLNQLIDTDFEKLVQLLYRVDVSEKKLKQVLQTQPGQNAGLLIAKLMVERQLQKIKSRQESRNAKDDPEAEKW